MNNTDLMIDEKLIHMHNDYFVIDDAVYRFKDIKSIEIKEFESIHTNTLKSLTKPIFFFIYYCGRNCCSADIFLWTNGWFIYYILRFFSKFIQ